MHTTAAITSEALVRGEPQAFAALFDEHAPRVARFLRGVSEHEVEDAVQETFLRLYRQRAKLPAVERLGSYVLGVARHVVIDRVRQERSRSLREERVAVHTGDADPTNPCADAIREERRRLARVSLEALEPEVRSVLALRHLGALTLRELAEAIGCSVPTARVRLEKAARAFAIELRRRGLDPEELKHDLA